MAVKASIQKLKTYWQEHGNGNSGICNGATDEEINSLKSTYAVKLPEPFIEAFKLCNEDFPSVGYKKEPFMWFGVANTHYSVKTLLEANKDMQEWGEWDKDIIFFYTFDGAFYAALDMRKNSQTEGKVLCVELEAGEFKVWANSYEEWLEMTVNEVLQHGELRVETIEEVLNNNNH